MDAGVSLSVSVTGSRTEVLGRCCHFLGLRGPLGTSGAIRDVPGTSASGHGPADTGRFCADAPRGM
eukprot:1923550-Pyramimonas_sp.AAC.1